MSPEEKKQKMISEFKRMALEPRLPPTLKSFYDSDGWRRVRYLAILKSKGLCEACGEPRKPLHIDHIKPRSKYPELELDIENLQALCLDCNLGKSNWDETDWRKKQ